MLKRFLLAGALLAPFGGVAQPNAGAVGLLGVSVFRLIKGTSIESARNEEVWATVTLDWPAEAVTPEARATQLNPVLMSAKRGVIGLNRRIDASPDSADLYRRRGILRTALLNGGLTDALSAAADLNTARAKGSQHPELDYELARAHIVVGALTKSTASISEHLVKFPNDPRGYRLRALAEMHRSKGDHAEHCRQAIPDLERALALDSTDFSTLMLRGYARTITDQLAAGIADYRRALTISPTNTQTHFFLAEALLAAGNEAEACEHFAQAEAFAPKTTRAYHKKYCK